MKLFIGFLLLSLVLICCTEEYKLSVEVTGNGSYEVTPQKNNYDEDETVSISAIPDSGYYFYKWSGNANSNSNPLYLKMDGDKYVELVFKVPFKPSMSGDWEGIQYDIEFHIQQALFDSSLTGTLVLNLPDGRNISYSVSGYNNAKLIELNCQKIGYYEIEYLGTWSSSSKVLGGMTEAGVYYKCDLQRQGDAPLAGIQQQFIPKQISRNNIR